MRALTPATAQLVVTGGLPVRRSVPALADLSGLPAYRLGEYEATARGTAYLLVGCPKHWPEPAPGLWFTPCANAALVVRYRKWRSLMEESVIKTVADAL